MGIEQKVNEIRQDYENDVYGLFLAMILNRIS
jgi:hypothetical protein